MNEGSIRAALLSIQDRKVEQKGNSIWICCPYHSSGQEKTPSLKVTLESNKGFPSGNWVCFGCTPQQSGNWHKLAVKLGFRESDDDEDIPYVSELGEAAKNKFLSDEDEENKLHEMLLKEPLIQKSQDWRGIKGWLLNDLQARVTMLGSTAKIFEYTRVYLPVHVNGKWKGGIFCSWSEKARLKYENEKHDATQILFPYDYVVKQLDTLKTKDRKICFVEGPRDALNLIQNGILAVANLGGETVWSEDKTELLSDLNLKALVVATDPDKVGKSLANKVKSDLSNSIGTIVRFKMEATYAPSGKLIRKEDPGNLSPARMSYLARQMEGL